MATSNPAIGAFQTIVNLASLAQAASSTSTAVDLANRGTSPKVHRTNGLVLQINYTHSTLSTSTAFKVEVSPDDGTTYYIDHEYDLTLDADGDDFRINVPFIAAHENKARVTLAAAAGTGAAGAITVLARCSGAYKAVA